MTPARRLVGELLGTGLLAAAVVGFGIMGERLSSVNVALALLANTLATGPAAVEGAEEKRLVEFGRVRDELRSCLKNFAKL